MFSGLIEEVFFSLACCTVARHNQACPRDVNDLLFSGPILIKHHNYMTVQSRAHAR